MTLPRRSPDACSSPREASAKKGCSDSGAYIEEESEEMQRRAPPPPRPEAYHNDVWAMLGTMPKQDGIDTKIKNDQQLEAEAAARMTQNSKFETKLNHALTRLERSSRCAVRIRTSTTIPAAAPATMRRRRRDGPPCTCT